ncbi:MAG: NAD-dependent dihydropyrimidine dehydrogenase subunit PreA, partial [bacterium]
MQSDRKTFTLQHAIQEAGRCLLCYDAPCNTGCGADTDPATFILKIRLGNIKGAVRSMRQRNILAATCAQVCPTCRLCVQGCSRSGLDEPIRIAEIQAFLAEYERQHGMRVLRAPSLVGQTFLSDDDQPLLGNDRQECLSSANRHIAVIGSGPAGLSAAANLALRGYAVTVFEKMPEPGGILRYGIPDHRLSPDLLNHEINLIRDLGVQFQCGQPISSREELEGLLADGYDAVFLATGLDQPYRLPLLVEALENVYTWDNFLRSSKDTEARKELAARLTGRRVVVVGGGSVAMDCAITAKNLGADRVYAVSLESLEELPADEEEKESAFRAGVRFKPNCRVERIIGENCTLKAIQGVEIRWRKPGWFVPQNAVDLHGTEFTLPLDVLIIAIGAGFSPQLQELVAALEVQEGRLSADPQTRRTSNPRIFAGGDMTSARQTVAACVLDGKKAAEAIAKAFSLDPPVVITKSPRPSLEMEFCGKTFINPFCLSSSPVGNTAEMVARAFEAGWGGCYFKTLNLDRDYHVIDPTPRLNALHYQDQRFIGLQNIEMVSERPLDQNLKDIVWLKKHYPDRVLISSIMGFSEEGWIELAETSVNAGADLLELNFSCPQMAVEGAGHKVGQDFAAVEHYTRLVKQTVPVPIIAKMTPNITDMLPVALAAKAGGADAISAINTIRAITEVDLETFAPKPTIQGRGSISGYSGPAVKPIALRFIAELAQSRELDLPVSGIGGIVTWQDAAMFLLLGASNLQATTAVMRYGYRIVESLCEGME